MIEIDDTLAPIRITLTGARPIAVELPASPVRVDVRAVGPRGPRGPDPWDDLCQVIEAASGAVVLDYAAGKHVRIGLAGPVSISFTGWPADRVVARMTLHVSSAGAFEITYPDEVVFPEGGPPSITPGGRDLVVFVTDDGGATVLGSAAGLNFA